MALRSSYLTHHFSNFSLRVFVQELNGRVDFCSVTVLAGTEVAELGWSAYRSLCSALLERVGTRSRGSFSVALRPAASFGKELNLRVEFDETPSLLRCLLTFSR